MAHTLGAGLVTATTSGTSIGLTITATTSGRGLIALVWFADNATATISSITCSGESNFTLIGSLLRVPNSNNYGIQIGYISTLSSGGDKSCTATLSASAPVLGFAVIEFAGGNTSAWYDSAEAGATGNTNAPTVSVTTNTADDLLIGMVAANGGGDPTPGSGYTNMALPNIYWWEGGQYNLNVGAVGSKTFDMALPSSGEWGIKCAAFKPAAAAAASFPPPRRRMHGLLGR